MRSMSDLLHHAPCGFVTFAHDGVVQAVNATLLDLMGLTAGTVVGQPFHHLLARASKIFYQTHVYPLLKMHGQFEEIYLSLRAGNGDDIPVLMNANTRQEDGRALHDCVLVRVRQRLQFETTLLTERKKAQAANKAKDDFLAALSHELRTPLNPILMLATEMSLDQTLPPEARAHAGIIRRNAELEARLMDDLLDLTRIAHGKINLVKSIVSLHDLLTHTEDIAQADCTAKGLRLTFAKAAMEHHMECDFARMQQVFWNLVKNAIKFTPEGGSVHVITRQPAPGHITISVTDTGIGIPADVLPHIFEAFNQGSITTHQFGGLGLGLAIVKSIVELHGGTIAVTSAGAGQGTTFTVGFSTCPPPVTLPLKSVTESSQTSSTASGPSLRLLLVEDHDSTREVLARILRRSGHDVHAARTAAEALRLTEEIAGFHVVISDIGLPDQSGLELMRQLRDRHGLPGIALSGYGMEEDLKNARAAGFFAHLVKPLAIDQLHDLLSQLAAGKIG